ncbi:phage holin family protein [Streptomyces griseosporeus]|uniref:phage holin family protein n=1 Tax=Streptomyces griseosporeus TaxID=1910 RepID=UPI0036F52A4B
MTGTIDVRPARTGPATRRHVTPARSGPATQHYVTPAGTGSRPRQDSVGALVGRAGEQLSLLVRQEVALAKEELAEKGRRAGRGGGLLGAAGAFGYAGLLFLAGTATAALSLVLSVWASALIVTAVLFVIAAVLGMVGRAQLRRASPPAPSQAIDSVRADVEEIRERVHR